MNEVVEAYLELRKKVEKRVNDEVQAGKLNPESVKEVVDTLMKELVAASCKK